ncbi:MAG: hypothetical protein H6825_13530 [Planctomycetes bacterium]|nr:hypothetical protein [Planctomycetota bacterium]
MRMRCLVLLAAMGVVGCGSVPRFVMHPVGPGFDLARLQQLYARYDRPIVVLEGQVYVPDWGCVCERGLVVDGVALVDPRSDRLLEDVVDESQQVDADGQPVEAARPPLNCYREVDDLTLFRLEGEYAGTPYAFDGQRLVPLREGVVPLGASPR